MKRQLFTLLIILIPLSGISKTTLTINYSTDEAGVIVLEHIEDAFTENYNLKYSDSITGDGSFSLEFDLGTYKYYRILLNGHHPVTLKLLPEKNYTYTYTFKNRVATLTADEEDDNTRLCDYNRSYNNFILGYIKPRGKGLRKKVLKEVKQFNADAIIKYGALTPEMVYLDKYNQFMLAVDLEKYNKAMQVGDEVVIDTSLDFKNPYLKEFLRYYVDMDFALYSRKETSVPVYWNINSKQALDNYLFGHELYENKNIEALSKLSRLTKVFNEKNYTNGGDLLGCADSIVNTPNLDMDVRFSAFRLHKKIHAYYSNRTAPDFKLKDGNGVLHNLTDYRGKPVVLDFWATWCKPCVQAMPELAKVYEQYKDKVHFISISSDDKIEKMNEYVEEKGYEWTFLFAGDHGKIKSDYEAYAIPRLVLIDAEGNVVDFDVDYPHELPAMIDKLLKE